MAIVISELVPVVSVVLIVWFLIIGPIILAIRHSPQNTREVYDKCLPYEAKYRYFIKFVLNPKFVRNLEAKRYLTVSIRIFTRQMKATGPLLVLDGTFFVRLSSSSIARKVVDKSEEIEEFKVIANRSEKYSPIHSMGIHVQEERQSLFLDNMELIGIDTKEYYFIPINRKIENLSPIQTLPEQLFECERIEWTTDHKECKRLRLLSFKEMFIFLFMTTNLVMVMTTNPYHLLRNEWIKEGSLLKSLEAIVYVFFIHLVVLMVYRFGVKQWLGTSFGSEKWRHIDATCLALIFMVGLVLGSIVMAFYQHFTYFTLLFTAFLNIFPTILLLMCFMYINAPKTS